MKNDSLLVFSANDSKKIVTVWGKYLIASERFSWFLSKYSMFNRLWSYGSWDIEDRNIKRLLRQLENTQILYIRGFWHIAIFFFYNNIVHKERKTN